MYYLTSESGIQPDIPSDLSDSCRDFLTQCFRSDPAARPTGTVLLNHKWLKAETNSSDSESTSYYGEPSDSYIFDSGDSDFSSYNDPNNQLS